MLRRLLVAIPAAFLFALFAASVVSAHEGHDHSLLTADAGQELRGRVVETHGDTMTGEAKGRTFWLETGAERIRLVGAPDSLRPGERVRVRGTRKGESFLVAADPGAVTADGPVSVASVGPAVTKTVAVIAFTFSDNTSQPWTTDQIRANFFATSNSVRSYFSDASYGQVTVTGDVFGWYQIAANDNACDASTWGTQAKAAATAAGVNLGAYQHIVFIFPRSAACGWAGLAYMPGTESWNNGTLSVRVAGHELAHNFGVHHASTLACTSGGVPRDALDVLHRERVRRPLRHHGQRRAPDEQLAPLAPRLLLEQRGRDRHLGQRRAAHAGRREPGEFGAEDHSRRPR